MTESARGFQDTVANTKGRTTVRLLGARIDCLRVTDLLEYVRVAVRDRAHVSVMYVNVHCMNVRRGDSRYAEILGGADVVYCDGTGIQVGALLQRLPVPPRMTGADWIHDLCRTAVRHNLSLFFLGSQAGVAQSAALALQTRYPGIHIAGTVDGYEGTDQALQRINRAAPDILLVGMGTPTQENWIAAHRDALDVSVVWAVGALFDFVSGRIPRGPRWMTDHGFEWLCRLAVEPRKLWRRYLLGNPWFLWRVITRARS